MTEKESLKLLRIKADYTQQQLADVTGISVTTIRKYESKTSNLKRAEYDKVERLAKALSVEVTDIRMD